MVNKGSGGGCECVVGGAAGYVHVILVYQIRRENGETLSSLY